jgi:uncharacterized protein (DUF1800 family)
LSSAAQPPVDAGEPTGTTKAAKRKTYTRRGVLASAIAGSAAVGAIRLLVVDKPDTLPRLAAALGDDGHHHSHAWHPRPVVEAKETTTTTIVQEVQVEQPGPSPIPLLPEPQRIAQLLRRTTFGFSQGQLEQALSDGYARTVDKMLATPTAMPPPLMGGDLFRTRVNVDDLRLSWVKHMITTPTPLAERMTLFWHGHFTSDYRKVGTRPPFIYWQNQTWRLMAFDKLGPMLMTVTIDPAMLIYLDLGDSTGDSPNENYARELMELFTMGIGNYGESDVRAAAKALAGWRVPEERDNSKVGIFEPDNAYPNPVTFLGRTANYDTQAVIDRILGHPSVATFITGKLVRDFVTGTPDDAYVRRLADGYRASGYDMKVLLRDMFMSPEFSAVSNYRALVKSPIEFGVHAARALNAPSLANAIVDYASGTGHALYDPPHVGGWPTNAAWISSNSVVDRVNFASTALDALDATPTSARFEQIHLEAILGPSTSARIANAGTDDARRWLLGLASPEFQLK